MSSDLSTAWLALVVGNTRLHWGFFQQQRLVGVWHTPHLSADGVSYLKESGFSAAAWQAIAELTSAEKATLPQSPLSPTALWMAAAVPTQAALWLQPPVPAQPVERSNFPIAGLYSTLGLDRAVNLLGAGYRLGWPVLVIDGGTALTFTAGGSQSNPANSATLYGGAILPGIRLQGQALAGRTAALDEAIAVSQSLFESTETGKTRAALPPRWATDTAEAIASGLAYGAAATIADYLTDWWRQFPEGKAVLTGGDGPALYILLQHRTPALAARVQVDSHLMFWGMRAYRQACGSAGTSFTA